MSQFERLNVKNNTSFRFGSIQQFLRPPGTITRAAVLFLCMFTGVLINLPFYGDHVTLMSSPANWFYAHGCSTILLPDDLDTGHPPFYPYFTAICWSVFGKHLWVSHVLTLFFGLFLLSQFIQMVKRIQNAEIQSIAIIFLLLNPVFLAQMANMSLDILLCAVFFMGLNAIEDRKRIRLIISCILLTIISLRGFIGVMALILYEFYQHRKQLKIFTQRLMFYIIGIAPVLLFFTFRYLQKGWWLYPKNGNWASDRSFTDSHDLLPKLAEFTIRIFEFGMLIPACLLILFWIKKRGSASGNTFAVYALVFLLCLAVFLLPFKNSVLIRYLLPFQLLLIIHFSMVVWQFRSVGLRVFCYVFTGILCVAQHFVVYPQMRSSVFEYNWGDGSLAHLSYFSFRAEAHAYLKAESIPDSLVYTSFPDYKSFADTDLTSDSTKYQTFQTERFHEHPYIIYCNNMNQITKEVENEIKQQFIIEKSWYQYPVTYTLYRNREINKAGD